MNHYSPHTGEHIATDTPAPWMGSTELAVPAYDKAAQGAFFVNGAWAVVSVTPQVLPVKDEIIALEAGHPITHRALRETILAVGQIASQLSGQPMESNPTISRILDLEAQIDALRGQL